MEEKSRQHADLSENNFTLRSCRLSVLMKTLMKALHTWYEDRVAAVVVKEDVLSDGWKADCSDDADRESDLDRTVDRRLHHSDASRLQSDRGARSQEKTKWLFSFFILDYLLPFVSIKFNYRNMRGQWIDIIHTISEVTTDYRQIWLKYGLRFIHI